MENLEPPGKGVSNESVARIERNKFLNKKEGMENARRLQLLLEEYKDKRVLVLAPPSAGKSTLLQHIPEGVDMDDIFDTMPAETKDFIFQREAWSSDIKTRKVMYLKKEFIPGNERSVSDLEISDTHFREYVNANMKVQPGRPVFGTKVIDCDVIIYLKLSDEVYRHRLDSRNKNPTRQEQPEKAFAIKALIERDIESAKDTGVIVKELEINEI